MADQITNPNPLDSMNVFVIGCELSDANQKKVGLKYVNIIEFETLREKDIHLGA